MNDDALKRLLRNSLLGRRAPSGLWDRVSARLSGAPRRPLALTLFAFAAILTAAGLKLALRSTPELPVPPVLVEAAQMPAWMAAAVEQHRGLDSSYTKMPPLTTRELTERVRDQSKEIVDLPSLREAGFEPREAHSCLEMGFAHVIYANTWSKLSCFVFHEDKAPMSGVRQFTSNEFSVIAVDDGPHLKLWVSDLRPSQIAAIARDAQEKKNRMETTELKLVSAPRIVETVLMGMPGVTDVRVENKTVSVDFDEKQTSADAIRGYALERGVAEWGTDGR